MTDNQINAAIAEACGWTKINVEHRSGISPTNGLRMGAEFFPKYTKDFNAMHEAERSLHEPLREMYVRKLLGEVADSPTYLWDILTAHPRSRAEAFLRTLGKWEEAE
jgi:hypothetical protein